MNGIILILAALTAIATAAPGGHGYGLGYGFIAAGHGNHYGHYAQPGVAKVEHAQAPHSYQYGVSESGPHYHKEIHQTGNFHHTVAVPVAHHGYGLAGHGYGHAGYGHAGLALGHAGLGHGYGHVY